MKVHNKTAEKIRRMASEGIAVEAIAEETGQSCETVRAVLDGEQPAKTPKEPRGAPKPEISLSGPESELVKRFMDQVCIWWLEQRGVGAAKNG